jgi:hypothetical protein
MSYNLPQFKLEIDSTARTNYGLNYPITYCFNIPSGSSNLRVVKKSLIGDSWVQLSNKTTSDYFNGDEVVRFDYVNNKAYVSVSFGVGVNQIYILFRDVSDELVTPVTFSHYPTYYDDRQCAAVITSDAWMDSVISDMSAFLDACISRQIWGSIAIVTGYVSSANWTVLQNKIDQGYVDVISHGYKSEHLPYADYDLQVGTSKSDIETNLTLPNNGRLLSWLSYYSEVDATENLKSKLEQYKYLNYIAGTYGTFDAVYPDFGNDYDVYENWNGYGVQEGLSTSEMNTRFNTDYANGNIYFLRGHAYSLNWSGANALTDHLDYLEGKTDVWFVGANDLFNYHYPINQNKLTVSNFLLEIDNTVNISDSVKLSYCIPGTLGQSKYGTFRYGQRKYGKNVTICEALLNIDENKLIKINDGYSVAFQENLTISESVSRVTQTERGIPDNLVIGESIVCSAGFKLSLSDSVAIDDGFGIGYELNLSDTIDIETLLEVDFTEGGGYKSQWRFLVKNSTGSTIASLVNARKRWFVQRLNAESEAGFILDVDDTNCNTTILNLGVNQLHIEYKNNLMWSGQIVSAKKIANKNDIYWEVLAKDWVALLGKRFCGVEDLREFTTTDAGLIAKTLIQETQALANGSFGITYGTIEASINRTTTYDKKNVLSAIKELSNMGKDGMASYGFDFEITPGKVFNVYYPYKGSIREEIVFRYPGNCETFEAFVDSWDIVNQEWGLGTHWTGASAVVSRADATSQTTYKRREAIKTYADMSVLAFLQDMVYQDIQWGKEPSTVVKFTSRIDEKSDILDYEVGDGVSVVCDKFDIDEWLWVYERKIEIGENDEVVVNMTVGD